MHVHHLLLDRGRGAVRGSGAPPDATRSQTGLATQAEQGPSADVRLTYSLLEMNHSTVRYDMG